MKRALYVGISTPGTTSYMRAKQLIALLPGYTVDIINTDIPFENQSRIFRSLGFRYKIGPLIQSVNDYVVSHLQNCAYELIWVDKAVFLTEKTTRLLKEHAQRLVHYTPDTAFYSNKSRHFYNSIGYYDFVVTTKSFELSEYYKCKEDRKVILTTQGFDKNIHVANTPFEGKKDRIIFIGLAELARENLLSKLLKAGLNVAFGGKKWANFANEFKNYPNGFYLGDDIRGMAYSKAIGESYFGLGLLSKKFPELHTTRTFEIPACGTALITEKNAETANYFGNNDAIFYSDVAEMIDKINYYRNNLNELEALTLRGQNKVESCGYDYGSIMENILYSVMPDIVA